MRGRIDAAPDLSGADEAFRPGGPSASRRLYGALLREHREQLGPNVTWNTGAGHGA